MTLTTWLCIRSLFQVNLKFLGSGVSWKDFERFFQLKQMWICFIVAPPDPRRPWFEQTRIYIISESFPVNMSSSGSVDFQLITLYFCISVIISHWKSNWPFFWTNQQLLILFTQGWFVPSLTEIGLLILEEEIFFNINTCKYGFPYCGPFRSPGTMICTNLNLHYTRELSCKYQLFWLCGSWEDF
jgi:hypothetical protein